MKMKNINDFIDTIKTQDELMSLNEAKSIIADPQPGFLSLAWKSIGLIAVVLLGVVSTLFWLLPNDKNEVTPPMNEVIVISPNDILLEDTIDSTLISTLENETEISMNNSHQSLIRDYTNRQANIPEITRDYKDNVNPTKDTTGIAKLTPPRKPIQSNKNKVIFPDSESYYYDQWEKAPQSFTINPSVSNVLQGEEGTIIIIPPFAVCGNYESFESEIKLTEYYKREDMLLGQLSTASDGKILESAGMVSITAETNGKALKLCKDITILFPSQKYQDDGYIGFNGTWDDGHNTVDWTPLGGGNRSFFGGTIITNCNRKMNQAIRCNWDTRLDNLRTIERSNIRADLRNDEVIRRIRKRFWFRDSCTSKLYDEVYEGIKYRMKDTLSASAYHACRIAQEKAQALQSMLNTLRMTGDFDPYMLNTKTGYILTRVSNFGVINCDRFIKSQNPKDYTYKIDGSEGVVSSRLIFHDIKSMIAGQQTSPNEVRFRGIPKGEVVTLLVIKYLADKILVGHQEMNTGEESTLQFKEVEKEKLAETLKAIANEIGN
jgi:hypothetical protein|tara:strand:- start:288 stop:1928 length:1641 start_codon:yes stop_codon:yes gene_type:complete